jgi:hypothetical protein
MNGWIKTAKVGDEIVCIDDSVDYTGQQTGLKNGKIYKIEAIIPHELDKTFGVVVEVKSWHPAGGAWHPRRFRPVERRSTDISSFTKLLNTAPAEVREKDHV